MAGNLGSLIVDISANVAKFSADMDAVRRSAESSAQRMDSAFKGVIGTLKAVGEALALAEGFALLKDHIQAAIEASAGLENLAARTGTTVEGLSSLAAVARLSGTDTEQLATGLTKLDKSLSALNADSPKSVAAFASIGLSARDFIGLSADQTFQKVAVAMSGYADGVEKTAAAQLIFGKAGASLIPVLRDTAEAGDLVAVVTAKQAHEAEQYEKTLRQLTLAHDAIWRQLAAAVTPALQAFASAMLEAATGADGLNANVKRLSGDGSIKSWAESAAMSVAFVVDAFDGVVRATQIVGIALTSLGALTTTYFTQGADAAKAIGDAALARIDAILQKSQFSDRLAKQFEAQRQAAAQQGPPGWLANKPTIQGATSGSDDKSVLDQQLKTLQAFITSENDLLRTRDAQLKRLYDDNRVSINDYFSGLRASQDNYLATVTTYYSAEIAAVEDYIAHAETKKEKQAGELKILELQAQLSRAVQAEGAALAKITDDQAKAVEGYTDKLMHLNAQLLIQQGRTAEAAQIQLEATDRQLRARLTAEGNVGGLSQLAATEQNTIAQKQLNDLHNEAAIIEEKLNTQVGYVNLAVKTGQIGELQGLAQTDAARRAQIDQLERIADEYLRIAHTVDDQGRTVAAAEAFKLKIDELAASTDTLGKKFNDMFETAFSDNFAKVIDGTESVRNAFNNMMNSIFSQLSKLAAQDIAKQIFGGAGGGASGGGGLFSMLGSLFSGGGGSGLAAGQAGPPANLAGSSGGFFSSIASLFSGAAADGGDVSGNKAYLVGERGPELFMPGRSGSIAPAGSFGGSTVVHVHMPAGIQPTRESMNLAGAAVARHLAVSSARNN
jgi:hypothetical protein